MTHNEPAMGVMLSEDEDIRPITWETRDEYVDRMLLREICCVGGVWSALGNLIGSPPDKFKEYYRHAYDEYYIWGHELVEGVFTIALLADVKDKGGPWWRADLFKRVDLSDDDEQSISLSSDFKRSLEHSIEKFKTTLACPLAGPLLLEQMRAAAIISPTTVGGNRAY